MRSVRKLCREAKSCRIPLELNLLGLREDRHYPTARFWEIAAEEGCSVILGSDAHRPEHVYTPEVEAAALDFLAPLGLTPMEKLELTAI